MKKNLIIVGAYLVFVCALCLLISALIKNVPELLPGKSSSYIVCRGFLFFLKVLPSVLCSGFLVSESINFAKVSEKAKLKFSPVIMREFRRVMIGGICMVLALTVSKEIASPLLESRQRSAEEAPRRVSEYLVLGQGQFAKGNYALAHEYARTALTIEPKNAQAMKLIDDTEAILERMIIKTQVEQEDHSREYTWQELAGETVTSLIQKSKDASASEDWFLAHYYAKMATELATPKDVNVQEAKRLASAAWNRLSIPDVMATTEAQQLYLAKKKAYTVLMSGDNIEAYYDFLALKEGSELGAGDRDVKRYLGIAENRLMHEVFFSEETVNLKRFETYRNVYFALHHKDGSSDVVFIEGITPVQETGDRLTYLRGFNMFSYDTEGHLLRTLKTPYAKMRVMSVSAFSYEAQEQFALQDSYKEVPALILKSVAQESRGVSDPPVYWFSDKVQPSDRIEQNFLVLPMAFDDYLLVCEAAMGANQMSLPSLLKINARAAAFGFSDEIYGVALVRRMLYPMAMLIIFIILASVAWNYRLGKDQLFKFSWILLLPVAAIVFYFAFEILFFIADLVYYALTGFSGNMVLLILLVCALALMLWFCATFLSRTGD